MAEIKRINIGGTEYDLVDTYARTRLEGEGTAYAISCLATYTSGHTYTDYRTGQTISNPGQDGLFANTDFNSGASSITVTTAEAGKWSSRYLILYDGKGSTTTTHKVLKMTDMAIGDTVYIIETEVGPNKIPDRWVSGKGNTTLTFDALEGKVDLSNYVTKLLYSNVGTTDVKNDTVTVGDHEAATLNGSTGSIAQAPTETGEVPNHLHTILFESTDFDSALTAVTETAAGAHNHTVTAPTDTVYSANTVTADSSSHTHSIGSSTISVNSAPSVTENGGVHSHTITVTPSTDVVKQAPTATGNGGVHTHTITVTPSTETIKAAPTITGNAGAHNHTVTLTRTVDIEGTTPVEGAAGMYSDYDNPVVDNVWVVNFADYITNVDLTAVENHSHGITGVDKTVVVGIASATAANSASHTHSITPINKTVVTGIASATAADSAAHSHVIDVTATTVVKTVDANTGAAGVHSHNIGGSTKTFVKSVSLADAANHTHNVRGNGSASFIKAVESIDTEGAGAHGHTITPIDGTVTVSVALPKLTHSVSVTGHSHSVTVDFRNR